MKNPLQELIDWLKGLDHETQLDIAFMTHGYHPGFERRNIPTGDALLTQFYAKFEEYLPATMNGTGFVLSFRSIFDYVFISRRGTAQAWENSKKLNQKILEDVDQKFTENMKVQASHWLEDLPNKIDKWNKISSSWNDLINTSISDVALEQWESKQLVELNKAKIQTVHPI